MSNDLRRWIKLCEAPATGKAKFQTLASVRDYARRLNVALDVDEDAHTPYISLAWIEGLLNRRPAEKGAGAKVMQALCSYADFTQKEIGGEVLAGEPKLMNYYKQFGFEIDPDDEHRVNSGYWAEGSETEDEPGPQMDRQPQRS